MDPHANNVFINNCPALSHSESENYVQQCLHEESYTYSEAGYAVPFSVLHIQIIHCMQFTHGRRMRMKNEEISLFYFAVKCNTL